MEPKQRNAFITARKGFCCLTVRYARRNHEMMRIRSYKIDPVEKREMRRLYPDVAFDWKKITAQLAEKREACRCYRSRRRSPDAARYPYHDESAYGVYEPGTRTLYTSGIPASAAGMGALLDAVLRIDRSQDGEPSWPSPTMDRAEPPLAPVGNNRPRRQ